MGHKIVKYPENIVVKNLREEHGLSLRDLEQATGLNHTTLWEIEKGYTRLNQQTLQIYSDFFNVSYDYLLGKQKNELAEKGLTRQEIALLLSNDKVIRDLQVRAMVILSMLIKEDDINITIRVMLDMLKESDIDVKEEYIKKYERLNQSYELENKKELLEKKADDE